MLEREEHGKVTVLRMAHGKASAFDTEFLIALRRAVEEVKSSDARALVLTGTGKIFSAGVDLRRILEGRSYIESFLPALDQFLWSLADFDKPLVAAINGHAIAGGCVVACAADRRICASEGITMGAPELTVGVPFPPSAFEWLRCAVPAHVLREVTLMGTIYQPGQALERGLVDELVERDRVLERALEVAQRMAEIPAASFRMTKAQVWAPYKDRAEADQGRTLIDTWSSEEVQSQIAQYVERTLRKR